MACAAPVCAAPASFGLPLAAPSAPDASKASASEPPPFDDDAFDDVGEGGGAIELDYTRLPAQLDAKLEALDVEASLRPTKINVGPRWTKTSQAALLAKAPSKASLGPDEQAAEKRKAFDLLDALSRSGSLPIECCSLHVVLAVTHRFDDSLIETVVAKNVNPIEKLERSALLVAETVQALPAPSLVRPEVYERVATYAAPMLLPPRE